MTAKERERLERACRIAREAGMEGEQLLLIRLEDVEEYLKIEELTKDILTAMDRLNDMRRVLKAEVEDGKDKEDSGEEPEDN
jgi:hypothetical protein